MTAARALTLGTIVAAALLALLVALPNEQWIMSAFKLSPSPDAERLVVMGSIDRAIGVAASASVRATRSVGTPSMSAISV